MGKDSAMAAAAPTLAANQGERRPGFRSGGLGSPSDSLNREIIRMLEHTGFRPQLTRSAGKLPTRRWRLVRYLGPARNHFRSHFYVLAERN